MKPTLNYGLSDLLIDAVRKAVEEALVGGQKKLDVDKDGKLEKSDFASLRAKKNTIDTKPKLKEEEQMDEAPLRAVNALVGYKLDKKVAAKGTPGSEDERNKAAAGLKRDRSGLGRRAYTGDQHYDVRREELEQMDESLDSIAKKHGMKYTTTAYGAGMKHPTKGEISINRYGEWHHKGTNKTGDSENDFSSLDKHLSSLDKHLSTVKKEEQMDEGRIDDLMDKRRLAAAQRHAGDPIVKPVRYNVDGTKYGGSAQPPDPEGADDADMKKAEPKRKSGSQGPMKRRSPFSAKSAQRLGKLDQQAK